MGTALEGLMPLVAVVSAFSPSVVHLYGGTSVVRTSPLSPLSHIPHPGLAQAVFSEVMESFV